MGGDAEGAHELTDGSIFPLQVAHCRALIEASPDKCGKNGGVARGPWIAAYMIADYTKACSWASASTGRPSMTTSTLLDRKAIAAHVLRHLARAQSRGRLVRLDELATDIGVRHEDVRDVVTSLHREGHVDAQRMTLTMSGLAVAAAMRECKLRDPRPVIEQPTRANVA